MRTSLMVFLLLSVASLAGCARFEPTQSSQAYQDYVSDQHLNTGDVHLTHGW